MAALGNRGSRGAGAGRWWGAWLSGVGTPSRLGRDGAPGARGMRQTEGGGGGGGGRVSVAGPSLEQNGREEKYLCAGETREKYD